MAASFRHLAYFVLLTAGVVFAPALLHAQGAKFDPRDAASSTFVKQLIKELGNPDETQRAQAAKQLGKLGAAAKEAIPALQTAMQDSDVDVRQIASMALLRVRRASAPSTGKPDLFVLSVGVDRYQAPVNNLSGCVNDARGLATLFHDQSGRIFDRVEVQTLVDSQATHARISAGLQDLRKKGKAGDWVAIVLSGHGGTTLNRWSFLTQDRGDITDATLLSLADDLAGEGKKVLLVIDACFAGQLRYTAHAVLNRHTDSKRGGIILAISSMPSQTSSALQVYSAFARAFEEGLSGLADYDQDQVVTLKEIRRYTYNRTYELCLQRRPYPGFAVEPQDSVIDASPSMAETTPLAQVYLQSRGRKDADDGPATPLPLLVGSWSTGKGAGSLGMPVYRLNFYSNGIFRASLVDAGRVVRTGDGVYKTTAKTVHLVHRHGADRLEIGALTDESCQLRFQGREFQFRRDAAPKNSVAGTSWSGSESLSGFGKLTFQFDFDGKAVMIDAKSLVNGTWTQVDNQVTITFQNCVYQGSIQGQVLSGNARYTSQPGQWTFSLTRDALGVTKR